MPKYDKIIFIVYGTDSWWVNRCLIQAASIPKSSFQSLSVVFFDGYTFYETFKNPARYDSRKGYIYYSRQETCYRFFKERSLRPIHPSKIFQDLPLCSKIMWHSHSNGEPFVFTSFDNARRRIFNTQELGRLLAQYIKTYNPSFCCNTASLLTIDLVSCYAGVSIMGRHPAALELRRYLKTEAQFNCEVIGRRGEYIDKGFVDLGYVLEKRDQYERLTELNYISRAIVSEAYRKAPKSKSLFTECKACGHEIEFFVYEYEFFLKQLLLLNLEHFGNYLIFEINVLKDEIPSSHNPCYLTSWLSSKIESMEIPTSFKHEIRRTIITPTQELMEQMPVCQECFSNIFQKYFTPREFAKLKHLFDDCSPNVSAVCAQTYQQLTSQRQC